MSSASSAARRRARAKPRPLYASPASPPPRGPSPVVTVMDEMVDTQIQSILTDQRRIYKELTALPGPTLQMTGPQSFLQRAGDSRTYAQSYPQTITLESTPRSRFNPQPVVYPRPLRYRKRLRKSRLIRLGRRGQTKISSPSLQSTLLSGTAFSTVPRMMSDLGLGYSRQQTELEYGYFDEVEPLHVPERTIKDYHELARGMSHSFTMDFSFDNQSTADDVLKIIRGDTT